MMRDIKGLASALARCIDGPKPKTPRKATGKATAVNVWVMTQAFGTETTIPNRIPQGQARHLDRCIKAGLVTATRDALTLTDAGLTAMQEQSR